jgi:hypothetical protein
MLKYYYQKAFILCYFLLFGILFLASCTKDDEIITRDQYIGTWSCKETENQLAPTTFSISMEALGTEDSLRVYNFNNLGASEHAIFIVNSSSVVIPSQYIDSFLVSGSGTLSNNKINLTYTVDSDHYTAECSQ